MPDPTCPFCTPTPDQLIRTGDLALALHDRYPVSPGHTLFITRRHISRLADTTPEERTALFALLDEIQSDLTQQHHPDGFISISGIDEGTAAGQTVPHQDMAAAQTMSRFHM